MKKNDFNSIASFYDVLARFIFGNQIYRSQLTHLHKIPSHANVLIIGGGTGWILNEILQVNPDVSITYIELSEKMLEISKKNLGENNWEKVLFIQGDENALDVNQRYDVIITNFFLDVFSASRLPKVIGLLNNSLKESGRWIVTDFVNPAATTTASSLLFFFQKKLIQIMYLFFRWFCNLEGDRLLNHRKYVESTGLRLVDNQLFFNKMITADLFVKMKEGLSIDNPFYKTLVNDQ